MIRPDRHNWDSAPRSAAVVAVAITLLLAAAPGAWTQEQTDEAAQEISDQIEALATRIEEDPDDIELQHYDARHRWLIQEWAIAEAKIMLGRIRGKYSSGLPSAGGDRTLDGEALIAEAREDKRELEAKVLDFQGPVMPMVY